MVNKSRSHLYQGILMSTTAYDRKILAERVGIF